MSTPSGRDSGGSQRPDQDGPGANETDDDRADTDPLPTMNLWSGGWGGSWAESPPADRPERSPQQPPPPAEPARGPHPERPVLGDVDLPRPPEPFAFPTTAPRGSKAGRNRVVLAGVGAVAALAVVGGLIGWLTGGSSSDNDSAPESGAVTTTGTGRPPGTGRDAAAEARLLRVLPPGYPQGACKPTEPSSGAVAMVKCDGNIDPGGPSSATFMLARDKAALDALFAGAVAPADVVICPGNIQSPGAWRRNANPQQVSGTLVCAMQGTAATVGWTDEARLLVSVVRSDPPGPTLDQLYQWWSSHS